MSPECGFCKSSWDFISLFWEYDRPWNMAKNLLEYLIFILTWLVVGPPLWKIWKSIGMISNPIYGKIKLMATKPPTSNYTMFSSTTRDRRGLVAHCHWTWTFTLCAQLSSSLTIKLKESCDRETDRVSHPLDSALGAFAWKNVWRNI